MVPESVFRGQEQHFWEFWVVKRSLIQDRKRVLPDQERIPVLFIMAAWHFQGTKQCQFLSYVTSGRHRKAPVGGRGVGKKNLSV